MLERLLKTRLSGWAYALCGCLLFLVKRAGDVAIARHFKLDWHFFDLLNYWLPLGWYWRAPSMQDTRFPFALALAAIPFACAGVVLTAARLRTLRRREALALFFFLPAVNLVFFAWLVFSRVRDAAPQASPPAPSPAHRKLVVLAMSVVFTAGFAVGSVLLLATLLQGYAWGIFLGIPFAIGLFSAYWCYRFGIFGYADAAGVALGSIVVTAALLLSFALEGLVCLAMAAPLAIPLALLGAKVGQVMLGIRSLPGPAVIMPALFLAPLLNLVSTDAPLRPVVTEVRIAAPPEVVWRNVIAFPELAPPSEFFFRAGVAYPQRARITGTGVGAVRYCEFSTGPFVEPVTVWDQPRLLRFKVTQSPEPLRELSPYDIHPPHLQGHFISTQGEFRLLPLPGGGTLLLGTTWYLQKLWPQVYWRMWSDAVVHRIHQRVLGHIKALAEADPPLALR